MSNCLADLGSQVKMASGAKHGQTESAFICRPIQMQVNSRDCLAIKANHKLFHCLWANCYQNCIFDRVKKNWTNDNRKLIWQRRNAMQSGDLHITERDHFLRIWIVVVLRIPLHVIVRRMDRYDEPARSPHYGVRHAKAECYGLASLFCIERHTCHR